MKNGPVGLKSHQQLFLQDYLISFFNGRKHSSLSVREKYIVKAVYALIEFMETGAIQKRSKFIHLDGSIGSFMK